MSCLKHSVLTAAKATDIPTGSAGLWVIKRQDLRNAPPHLRLAESNGNYLPLAPGVYTSLLRYLPDPQDMSRHETVMEDSERELRKHLPIMLHGFGRVLITGLGLGCVVRGCLVNPKIDHVTVIERDADVLKLVADHMRHDRLTIVHAEAEEFCRSVGEDQFDCCWHDVWTDPYEGEPHLQVKHAALFVAMAGKTKIQGAWEFPRSQRRLWRRDLQML